MNDENQNEGTEQPTPAAAPHDGVEETVVEDYVSFTPPASDAPSPPVFGAPGMPANPPGTPFGPGAAGPEPWERPEPTPSGFPPPPYAQPGEQPGGGGGQYPPYPGPYGQPYPGAGFEQVAYEQVPWSPKSKLAAGLFGILLGAFGVHNFYLGFTGKAVAQLLITVLSVGVLSFVSAIWGLVEGILVLSSTTGTQWDLDARGLPMRPIGSAS